MIPRVNLAAMCEDIGTARPVFHLTSKMVIYRIWSKSKFSVMMFPTNGTISAMKRTALSTGSKTCAYRHDLTYAKLIRMLHTEPAQLQ